MTALLHQLQEKDKLLAALKEDGTAMKDRCKQLTQVKTFLYLKYILSEFLIIPIDNFKVAWLSCILIINILEVHNNCNRKWNHYLKIWLLTFLYSKLPFCCMHILISSSREETNFYFSRLFYFGPFLSKSGNICRLWRINFSSKKLFLIIKLKCRIYSRYQSNS